MSAVRATVPAAALLGPDAAHQVISEHLRSNLGGRRRAGAAPGGCPVPRLWNAVVRRGQGR